MKIFQTTPSPPDPSLGIQLIILQLIGSALVGGITTLILKEGIDYIRRPKLSLNLDLSSLRSFLIYSPLRPIPRRFGKYIRFKVINTGRRPVEYCEAKIEILNENKESIAGVDPSILHWVRRYPLIYQEPDELYVPITINVKDQEFLDVVQITASENSDSNLINIDAATYSHRPFHIQSGTIYFLKVTVFSRNADPTSETLRFHWDGTWEGFNEDSVSLIS